MKNLQNLFLFLIILYISFSSLIQTKKDKTFLEYATDNFFNSTNGDREAVSLNPSYFTKTGTEQLNICKEKFQANFNRCNRFSSCNFCSANADCGWCDETQTCVPIDLSVHKDFMVPLCVGSCINLLKIEYCYKALFDPKNNKNEINFNNYKEVSNQFRKSEEMQKLAMINDLNSQSKSYQALFRNKEVDSNTVFPGTNSVAWNNDLSTNNMQLIDQNAMHKSFSDEMTNISKQTYSKLISSSLNNNNSKQNQQMLSIEEGSSNNNGNLRGLKQFIPNFEIPQFVTSDLETAINNIKKQKLLLYLRGYDINDERVKKHLPIYRNVNSFANKDQIDKFKTVYSTKNKVVEADTVGNGTALPKPDPSVSEASNSGQDSNDNSIGRYYQMVKLNNVRFKEKEQNNLRLKQKDRTDQIASKYSDLKPIANKLKAFINN